MSTFILPSYSPILFSQTLVLHLHSTSPNIHNVSKRGPKTLPLYGWNPLCILILWWDCQLQDIHSSNDCSLFLHSQPSYSLNYTFAKMYTILLIGREKKALANAQLHMCTQTLACTHACMPAHARSHTHTRTHTRTQTYTHTVVRKKLKCKYF